MIIEIRGKNTNLSDAVKSKIEGYIYGIADKYEKALTMEPHVHVDVSQYDEQNGSHVKITLTTKVGTFHAEDKENDLFRAVESTVKKIETQLGHKLKK